MNVEKLAQILDADFYTGVPDSKLKALCNYLMNRYGIDPHHHIIAANEGNCVALAAGYHLATGKVPVVYMQNSGQGNVVNPVASLLNDKVYGIPMIFIIGWRGEPGIHDEPQHIYQGEVTLSLLDVMDIAYCVIDKQTTEEMLIAEMARFRELLAAGKQVALVVRGGGISYSQSVDYGNGCTLLREEIIRHITTVSGSDPIISTTGKASRELFEIREENFQPHGYDFLTVGSMGHSSSIALGVAINQPEKTVWCIDGDGAALMHLGAMAVIGSTRPNNLIHVVINNSAHETVGGMPTVAGAIDLVAIAKACGYSIALRADSYQTLDEALAAAKEAKALCFIEVICGIGARDDLGRPTTSAKENKENFMAFLQA